MRKLRMGKSEIAKVRCEWRGMAALAAVVVALVAAAGLAAGEDAGETARFAALAMCVSVAVSGIVAMLGARGRDPISPSVFGRRRFPASKRWSRRSRPL